MDNQRKTSFSAKKGYFKQTILASLAAWREPFFLSPNLLLINLLETVSVPAHVNHLVGLAH
jgi:hypothetical protein